MLLGGISDTLLNQQVWISVKGESQPLIQQLIRLLNGRTQATKDSLYQLLGSRPLSLNQWTIPSMMSGWERVQSYVNSYYLPVRDEVSLWNRFQTTPLLPPAQHAATREVPSLQILAQRAVGVFLTRAISQEAFLGLAQLCFERTWQVLQGEAVRFLNHHGRAAGLTFTLAKTGLVAETITDPMPLGKQVLETLEKNHLLIGLKTKQMSHLRQTVAAPLLQELDLSFCNDLNEESLLEFLSSHRSLQKISLVKVKLSDGFLEKMVDACPYLEILDLSSSSGITITGLKTLLDRCLCLHTLSMRGEASADLLNSLFSEERPRLAVLDLGMSPGLTNDAVLQIVSNCPNLHTLKTGGCLNLSQEAKTSLAAELNSRG